VPAGATTAPRDGPVVGPPLTLAQVTIAVSAVLAFLAFVIILGQGGGLSFTHHAAPATPVIAKAPPTLGVMDQSIRIGQTVWGAAFVDQLTQLHGQTPRRGQFLAVGIVIGNQSHGAFALSRATVALLDLKTNERFTPYLTAWGTPSHILAGGYTTSFALPARQAIAGLIVFDVPLTTTQPRLLIRDLREPATDFTGKIDLTQRLSRPATQGHPRDAFMD
jgi:hypothetical protein